jgi:hypothetical protein
MAKETLENKVINVLLEALDNHWFNPTLVAHGLVSNNPIYTQDKLSDLIVEIIKQQSHRYNNEWELGRTSEGLMMSARLNDMVEAFEPIPS